MSPSRLLCSECEATCQNATCPLLAEIKATLADYTALKKALRDLADVAQLEVDWSKFLPSDPAVEAFKTARRLSGVRTRGPVPAQDLSRRRHRL